MSKQSCNKIYASIMYFYSKLLLIFKQCELRHEVSKYFLNTLIKNALKINLNHLKDLPERLDKFYGLNINRLRKVCTLFY